MRNVIYRLYAVPLLFVHEKLLVERCHPVIIVFFFCVLVLVDMSILCIDVMKKNALQEHTSYLSSTIYRYLIRNAKLINPIK